MSPPLRIPRMQSIWDEFIPQEFDSCDSDIVDVVYPSENGGVFRLTFDILPFDKEDRPLKKMRRLLFAYEAYVFDPHRKDFVVNQSLKSVYCYPEIIRMDLVTTGQLLRIECESYKLENH